SCREIPTSKSQTPRKSQISNSKPGAPSSYGSVAIGMEQARRVVDYAEVMWYQASVMRASLTALVGAMLVAGPAEAEQSWPQFRGPRGDGTSMAQHVPMT